MVLFCTAQLARWKKPYAVVFAVAMLIQPLAVGLSRGAPEFTASPVFSWTDLQQRLFQYKRAGEYLNEHANNQPVASAEIGMIGYTYNGPF